MFQIDQILKDVIKELQNIIRYYAKGCEDLTKKNDTLKAEKLKFGETIMVLKDFGFQGQNHSLL